MQQSQRPAGTQWYAIRVRSNFEATTSELLRHKGFEEFLPSYRSRHQWSDRIKETVSPLFPGYVFCRLNAFDRLQVLKTPGVVHIVSYGKSPAAIDERELDSVRKIVESGLPSTPWPYLREGHRVLIDRGPLSGAEGVLTKIKNDHRLVVSITLLQRSISAEVDTAWIRPR